MKRRTTNKLLREVERGLAAEMRAYVANVEDFGAADCPHLVYCLEDALTYRCRLDRGLAHCSVEAIDDFDISILAPRALLIDGKAWVADGPEAPSVLRPFHGVFLLRERRRRPLEYALEIGGE